MLDTGTKQKYLRLAKEYLNKNYESDDSCKADEFCCLTESRICDINIPYFPEPMNPSFSEKLFNLIKKQNITETECYKNANLDRRLFSKIRTKHDYQPSKNTVFALIFGLKLSLDDANDLLDSAGYSISHSLKMDVLIEFMIVNKIYNIFDINEILYQYKCPLLGNIAK
ncbi:MAG: hypothetical protein MJ158_03305 [Alphaproteobacteria bacterium]|nr:hypothetical protein [Alphaproteobacteria bacterium]